MTILTPQAPHLNARSDVIVMYMFHHVKCHVSVSRTRTSEELRFMITFGTHNDTMLLDNMCSWRFSCMMHDTLFMKKIDS